jgi:hypothetical protein
MNTLELFLQRIRSKTYGIAIVGALLTILEMHSNVITQYIPIDYRQYVVYLWPVVMITLREFTNTALSDK